MSGSGARGRPAASEYPAFLAPYVGRVGDADVVEFLRRQQVEEFSRVVALPPEQADFRYAPEKWSVREVIGHVIDAERIFAGRVLRLARGDETPLAGFDSASYVAVARESPRPLSSLVAELNHLRAANLLLFDGFDEAALARRGTASGASFTVRALIFFVAGHAQHHLDVLRERYRVA